MTEFSRDNPVLECFRLSCSDEGCAVALGVTQISHKLYYDLLTSTGGRDLIMFWEIHSHKIEVSTVFGPSYDSFLLDNILWSLKAFLTCLISDSCFSHVIR